MGKGACFLPGFSAGATGTCLDLTPVSTQALHTGTVVPHSETPEWFVYCSGTKRCDIREMGLVSVTLHPAPLLFSLAPLLHINSASCHGILDPRLPYPHGHPAAGFL